MAKIPIFFAEFPTLHLENATLAERSSILRAALESHIEGQRISERISAVMPMVRKRKKLMGGRAHSKGSQTKKAMANAEALQIKKTITKFMKEDAASLGCWLTHTFVVSCAVSLSRNNPSLQKNKRI
jgi:DNA invertase Pin-like site-specific DNA recombinase